MYLLVKDEIVEVGYRAFSAQRTRTDGSMDVRLSFFFTENNGKHRCFVHTERREEWGIQVRDDELISQAQYADALKAYVDLHTDNQEYYLEKVIDELKKRGLCTITELPSKE